MKINIKTAVTETITILFVILFLYTGICKIIDYTVFKEQIAMSPILHPLATLVAILLPWTEFLIVLLLVIPRWRLRGFYASFGLMSLFTAYIMSILIFNKNIPCSCGGVIELMSWSQHIIFNSVFILLALTGIWLEKGIRLKKIITIPTITEK